MSGSVILCFLLDPTDQAQESLRRYAGVRDGLPLCKPYGYHNADAILGRCALPIDAHDYGRDDIVDHVDPRWPLACLGCGYVFAADDQWQHNAERLYRRSDTAELVTLRDAPSGAMWFAPWYEDNYKGPDGRCLVVKTPAGEWIVDSPSSNSKTPWSRTGTPPNVTASPSIMFSRRDGSEEYHGWLRDGRLEEC